MDGERGNKEPGIVGGGGFKNVFSRGIGEGGSWNTGWELGITEKHDDPDPPGPFRLQGTLSFSLPDDRSVGPLPRWSFLRPPPRFEPGGLADAVSLARLDFFLARRGWCDGPGSGGCCGTWINIRG